MLTRAATPTLDFLAPKLEVPKHLFFSIRQFFFMLIYALVQKSTHPTHRAASFKTSARTGEFEVTKMITSVRTGKIVHWICNYFELLIFFKTSAELVCTLVN